jgi:drug/metabolite transporter (DMT)-like permease
MSPIEQKHRVRVIVSFAALYVLWGSTYLAMRVAVRDVPPYVLGTARYLISGPIMLAACALMGKKIRITRQDFERILTIGVLLLSIGNMGVVWGEEYVTSGMTALIVAIVPIWVVAIQTWIFKSARLQTKGLLGLAMGIGGLIVLLWPQIASGSRMGHPELIGTAILAVGSLAWAMGSVLSGRWSLSVDVFVSAAWQMTLAGLVNAAVAGLTGQFHHAKWTTPAVLGILYLVVAGSWMGFTSYIWLLEHVATTKVSTYAYVNPVVAVFLGWILLHEQVDAFMIVGTVIIIASVALVNTSKVKRVATEVEPSVKEPEIAAANVGGD